MSEFCGTQGAPTGGTEHCVCNESSQNLNFYRYDSQKWNMHSRDILGVKDEILHLGVSTVLAPRSIVEDVNQEPNSLLG